MSDPDKETSGPVVALRLRVALSECGRLDIDVASQAGLGGPAI